MIFRSSLFTYQIKILIFHLIIMAILFQLLSGGKGRYGLAEFGHDLGLMTGIADGDARPARDLPDSAAPMPYDLYRAEDSGGLIVEVLSDAPSEEVEVWLSRFTLPQAYAD